MRIWECYCLSVEGGMFGSSCNFRVIEKFCERYDLDDIAVLSICKSLIAEREREK